MAKRRPLSAVEREYNKERQRITRQMGRMEKRGYSFDNVLPPKPKKVTPGSVRRLKGVTTEKLYEESTFTNPETGATMPGLQGRVYERTHRKPPQTKVVLNHVQNVLGSWFPDPGWRPSMQAAKKQDVATARSILADAIATYGGDAVARNLEAAADRIDEILEAICYASDSHGTVSAALVEFTQILTGHSLSMEDNMYITERAERMDYDEADYGV